MEQIEPCLIVAFCDNRWACNLQTAFHKMRFIVHLSGCEPLCYVIFWVWYWFCHIRRYQHLPWVLLLDYLLCFLGIAAHSSCWLLDWLSLLEDPRYNHSFHLILFEFPMSVGWDVNSGNWSSPAHHLVNKTTFPAYQCAVLSLIIWFKYETIEVFSRSSFHLCIQYAHPNLILCHQVAVVSSHLGNEIASHGKPLLPPKFIIADVIWKAFGKLCWSWHWLHTCRMGSARDKSQVHALEWKHLLRVL